MGEKYINGSGVILKVADRIGNMLVLAVALFFGLLLLNNGTRFIDAWTVLALISSVLCMMIAFMLTRKTHVSKKHTAIRLIGLLLAFYAMYRYTVA